MRFKLLILFICSMFLTASIVNSEPIPKKAQWVNDLANILSTGQERSLSSYLKSVQEKSGSQIVVLTVNSLDGRSIEEYSLNVAEKWGIGQKGKDNGVLLVVSKNDRKLRIEVGYGHEGELTDAKCSYIIRKEIVPYFKANKYGEGIIQGVSKIASVILKESTITNQDVVQYNQMHSQKKASGGNVLVFILIIAFIFMRIFGAIGVYPTGIILFDILLSMGRFGGTGFGGGSSGFGGGFSGGGGGFGGGGASGGW